MAANPFELATSPLHLDANEVDSHPSGIPAYLLENVAREIVRLLVANGIDPNSAYFRGRNPQPEELTETERHVSTLAVELNEDYTEGHPYDEILVEREAQHLAQEEALGRQIDGPPPPQYELGTLDSLFRDDFPTNPIHVAGVTDESFIDVYDKDFIDALDPGQEEGVTKVVAIPDNQLSLAALACVKLNYTILG